MSFLCRLGIHKWKRDGHYWMGFAVCYIFKCVKCQHEKTEVLRDVRLS